MSKVHKVVSGDTLGAIAIKYLGSFNKWHDIVLANPQLTGRKTAIDGSPLIFPGDILVVPVKEKMQGGVTTTVEVADGEQDVAIVIGGKKFVGFTGYELNLSFDSLDTFSFSAPYDNSLKDLQEAIEPFSFKSCEIYYQGALVFNGRLLTPDPKLEDVSSEITLQGYPLCGVFNDCNVPPAKYPAQYKGLTVKQIADELAQAYSVEVGIQGNAGASFEKVTCEPSESILSFLTKLLKQRDLLFTNDEKGNLLFFTAKEQKAAISFIEGEAPLLSITPKFNAQGFYSHLTGFTKTDKENDSLSYTFKNKYLINKGVMRYKSMIIDDAKTQSDLEKAVNTQAGKMFADCVSYELTCEGHILIDNRLCKKGLCVCVKAPKAMIRRETNFIARNIKMIRTGDQKTTQLSLVLPGSYTGKIPEVMPWE